MSARVATILILGGLVVGCAGDRGPSEGSVGKATYSNRPAASLRADPYRGTFTAASIPDRGSLFAYERSAPAVRRGASVWHPIQVSEQHALRAISEGGLTIQRPDGQPIRVEYERHVVHPDGNWSWIGRTSGEHAGSAILTFGEKAVFGTIANGTGRPIQLTTAMGRTWIVETDPGLQTASELADPQAPDFIVAPGTLQSTGSKTAKGPVSASADRAMGVPAADPSQTVDVVLGYTSGFAARLGGTSQAVTRLNHLVDIANQAYADSQVDGRIRLVHTVQVDYPDATSNQSTLFELTGVSCTTSNAGSLRLPDRGLNCTTAPSPASLQPLLQAREDFGADLVSLVRIFNSPESGSCGTAWLLGAGQSAIDSGDAAFGFSVVGDTNGNQFPDGGISCREEYLAHELGHTMGLQHDRETAQGSDDTNSDGNLLDPEEYGHLPYTFGYVAGTDAGNFYTIMSLRRAGATGYRVFSNPRINICGGNPCGVADQADNARGLAITMPLVTTFRATAVPLGPPTQYDFNGDGISDILWRNSVDGRNAIWRSANSATPQAVATVAIQAWQVAGIADFNGDGVSDILWRNGSDGRNVIWRSGSSATPQAVSTVASQAWKVAGVGDFNGDGVSDILWRNSVDGSNVIWRSANSATPQAVAKVSVQAWKVVGIGDFNGDGVSDILWRNTSDGRNAIWRSANSATSQAVTTVASQSWQVAGIGDFNADGVSDILWRSSSDGRNAIWRSANSATLQAVMTVAIQAWKVAAVGDFNGDGVSDILWRNSSDGRNAIWLSANAATPRAVTTVPTQAWLIVR